MSKTKRYSEKSVFLAHFNVYIKRMLRYTYAIEYRTTNITDEIRSIGFFLSRHLVGIFLKKKKCRYYNFKSDDFIDRYSFIRSCARVKCIDVNVEWCISINMCIEGAQVGGVSIRTSLDNEIVTSKSFARVAKTAAAVAD